MKKERITMEDIKEMQKVFKEWETSYDDYVRETWEKTDSEVKLALTAYVFRMLKEHMNEGGTYRYLIYDRLGFGPEAYTALYVNGGMDLSNAFHDIRELEKEEKE
jgi:hypothetical protein